MSRRPGPPKSEKSLPEPNERQPKFFVQCSNCHYKVKRNEISTLEPCKHKVCEDCLDREETDSQGEYICPICVELNTEIGTPDPSQEILNEDDLESLNSKDRESLNGKDRESLNGKDQESLIDNDQESLNKYDQESLNGRDEEPLVEKDQESHNASDTEPPITPTSSHKTFKETDQEDNDDMEETSDVTTSRQIYLTGIDEDDSDKGNDEKSSRGQEVSKIVKEEEWESKPFCHRHYQDKVWYCLDCDNPMCKVCCRNDYHPRNHRLKNLEEVTQLLRSNAAQARDVIQGQLIPVMHQSLKHEERYKKSLPKRLETLRELVEKQATSIVQLVEEIKARTIEDLEHYTFQADKIMDKSLAVMNKQLQAAQNESQLLCDAEEASDAATIKMHKRLQEFFVRSKEGNLSSFFLHNRSRPDFNVMATVASSYDDYAMPRELVDAVKRHVGWAIDCPPVLVNDTRYTARYPLLQRGYRVPISQFPAHLSQTKKLIMDWRKFTKNK